MCYQIRESLQALRARRRELLALASARLVEYEEIPGGGGTGGSGGAGGSGDSGGSGGSAGGADPDAELAIVEAQIAATREALDECLANRPAGSPRPVTAEVLWIACDDSDRELGKLEPYLIVASVDMLARGPAVPPPVPPMDKPAVYTSLYGPYLQFEPGEQRSIDERAFWDLDAAPRTITGPEDTAFLVALVENDGSSPQTIRGAVNSALEVSIVNNLQRDYAALTDAMLDAMSGAIDTAALSGLDPLHLNADDRAGPSQLLSFTQDQLDDLYGFGVLERTLTFVRSNANGRQVERWRVKFRFTTPA